MQKHAMRIDCAIFDCADQGWNVVFHFNSEWYSNHLFATWAEAIAVADDKHGVLEQSGWTANVKAQQSVP